MHGELEIAAEDDPRLAPFTHTDERDRIRSVVVTIHSGPEHDSHLLLPRIRGDGKGPPSRVARG